MRTNTRRNAVTPRTHGGAPARRINNYATLRRSVLACLLWEKEFYEDGVSIANRILKLASTCTRQQVAELAVEARTVHGLRHVPLLLLLDLIRRGGTGVADAIYNTITRADEITELVSLYWSGGRRPLSKQMKLGLGRALGKFSEYQLAKYDRNNSAVRLRDVLFLCHPKPEGREQTALFKRLADDELRTPDTWEVALSAGADKRTTFTRMLREGTLGYMALLRNLRNMQEAGVDEQLIRDAIEARRGSRYVLPFRYIAAARAAPRFERSIDRALIASIGEAGRFDGRTIVLVDVSGSMQRQLSARSDLTRMDAACALGSVIDGDVRVFSFSEHIVEVPHRLGMSGVDAIRRSQRHWSTNLRGALTYINRIPHDRLIVITDEQATGGKVIAPAAKNAYMINVASYRNGVGYGNGWTHIDGFSEAVLKYIREIEG